MRRREGGCVYTREKGKRATGRQQRRTLQTCGGCRPDGVLAVVVVTVVVAVRLEWLLKGGSQPRGTCAHAHCGCWRLAPFAVHRIVKMADMAIIYGLAVVVGYLGSLFTLPLVLDLIKGTRILSLSVQQFFSFFLFCASRLWLAWSRRMGCGVGRTQFP